MRERVFQVDFEPRTAKCLLAAAEPDGGICRSCRQPVPALVDGHCTQCVIREGIDPLKFGAEAESAR